MNTVNDFMYGGTSSSAAAGTLAGKVMRVAVMVAVTASAALYWL